VTAPHGEHSSTAELLTVIDQLHEAQTVGRAGSWTWAIEINEVTWSPELYRILGHEPATFTPAADSIIDAVHEEDRANVRASQEQAIRGRTPLIYTARIVRPDDTIRWIEVRAAPRFGGGAVIGFVGSVVDITERQQAMAAIARSEARYRYIVDTTREGIWAIDTDGLITFVNARMAEMLGYPAERIVGQPLFAFLDEDSRELAGRILGEPATGGVTESESVDIRFVRRDGREVWTHVTATPMRTSDDDTGRSGTLMTFTDVTERKAADENLAHVATHDALTGLPNRDLLLDRIDVALARMGRTSASLALLCCDIDYFKLINDSLGHDAGDTILTAVAERLIATARPGDTVARTGGDEFVLCCEDVRPAAAEEIAARIARSLGKPFGLDEREIFVTVSVGIRLANKGDSPGELLRDADTAMYQAKEAGRARHAVFDRSLRARAELRVEIESGLHRALERSELLVFYQPTFVLRSGAVAGAEALIRWQHPLEGMRAPADFIGVAEETGLIGPMGLWVLDQACRQATEWHRRGAPRLNVAVNVSPRQLLFPDLVRDVGEILARTRIQPELLTLEITETALMQDADAAEAVLRSLKDLGLRLAIDDFGTGYSSLSSLRRFPIDILKIDRSFVAELGVDAESTAIVTSIAHLAHALHLEIVAEGVETREQLTQLDLLGCQYGQGFFWSPPVPAAELQPLLRLDRETARALGPPRSDGKFRVLIADDDVAHRRSLKRILDNSGLFTVVAEADDGQHAVEQAGTTIPDLVVLDLSMPRMDGLEALPRILANSPGTKVALLSGHIGRAPLAPGASAQIRKGVRPAELLADLLLVMGTLPD
jgi:diguanylate cyclase (GGDEF)-like protein/PAS domain S-box-containing protein